MKHVQGELHENGKWHWEEKANKGKGDWRSLKGKWSKTLETASKDVASESQENVKETKAETQEEPKTMVFKNAKAFKAETSYELSEEEVMYWLRNFSKRDYAVVRNTWEYLMGRIGQAHATIANVNTQGDSGKEKPFESKYDAPDWRPIGSYNYSVRGWDGKWIKIEGTIQSWEDVVKAVKGSDETFSIYLSKHPHQ